MAVSIRGLTRSLAVTAILYSALAPITASAFVPAPQIPVGGEPEEERDPRIPPGCEGFVMEGGILQYTCTTTANDGSVEETRVTEVTVPSNTGPGTSLDRPGEVGTATRSRTEKTIDVKITLADGSFYSRSHTKAEESSETIFYDDGTSSSKYSRSQESNGFQPFGELIAWEDAFHFDTKAAYTDDKLTTYNEVNTEQKHSLVRDGEHTSDSEWGYDQDTETGVFHATQTVDGDVVVSDCYEVTLNQTDETANNGNGAVNGNGGENGNGLVAPGAENPEDPADGENTENGTAGGTGTDAETPPSTSDDNGLESASSTDENQNQADGDSFGGQGDQSNENSSAGDQESSDA